MPPFLPAALLLSALALPACAQQPPGAEEENTPALCKAQSHIGQPVDAIPEGELTQPYRVLRPGDAATMDYNPRRINVLIDENGIITQIHCG